MYMVSLLSILPFTAPACGSAQGGGEAPEAPRVYFVRDITPENMVRLYEALERPATGKVAVKLSTGESGGHNFLKPELIKDLVQKVDERRRTIDPSGTLKLYNEYYELIFKTRKGDILHLVTSKQAYVNMPFHQQGTLTFQGERLIRFQYADGEVTENQQAFHTSTVSTAVAAGRR